MGGFRERLHPIWVPSSRAVLLSIFKVSPTKTVRRPTPHKNRYIKLVCRSGEPQFFCVATAAKKASTHKYISSRFLLLRASRAALCHTKSINTYARQGLAKKGHQPTKLRINKAEDRKKNNEKNTHSHRDRLIIMLVYDFQFGFDECKRTFYHAFNMEEFVVACEAPNVEGGVFWVPEANSLLPGPSSSSCVLLRLRVGYLSRSGIMYSGSLKRFIFAIHTLTYERRRELGVVFRTLSHKYT